MFIEKRHREYILPVALMGLVIVAVFSPCLRHDFVNRWDDGIHLTRNPLVRSLAPENIFRIFTTNVNKTYIPLTIFSFALEYHFLGYDPFVYHFNNLLLHLGVTALVFVFALQIGLSRRAAFWAAFFFGIHPMHVESVAWVTERKDVLYAFFYLSAMCVYWRYLETSRRPLYGWTLVLGCLSMLAKPMALSLPLALLVVDRLRGRPLRRETWLEKIPYLLYIMPLAWLTYSVHMRLPGQNLAEAALLWVWSFVFYIRQFVFPFVLIPHYPVPEPVTLINIHYGIAVLIFGIFCYLLFRFRRNRLVFLAGMFYAVSIFFLLRFDMKADVSFVADRFMYLPSMGFCLLAGSATAGIPDWSHRRRRAGRLLLAVFIFIVGAWMGSKTCRQCRVWENNRSLLTYIIEHHPRSYAARINRGGEYLREGKLASAMKDFNAAIAIAPDVAYGYHNRGLLQERRGRFGEALKDYDRALKRYRRMIETRPDYFSTFDNTDMVYHLYCDYARLYMTGGNVAAALDYYARAIRIDPGNPKAFFLRGRVYQRLKLFHLAQEDRRRARAIAKGRAEGAAGHMTRYDGF